MANPYTGTVAGSLRKSQLLLQLLPDSGEAGAEGVAGLEQAALQDAVVLQLWRAYRCFLAELAHQLQVGGEPLSPHQLARESQSRGVTSSEAAELVQLADDPDSWLAGLESAWQALWRFQAGGAPNAAVAAGAIPLRDLSRQPAPATSDDLRIWRQALAELVQRQRAHMEEC